MSSNRTTGAPAKIRLQVFVAKHVSHGGDLMVQVNAEDDGTLGKWICRCPCGASWVGDSPGLLGELGEVVHG